MNKLNIRPENLEDFEAVYQINHSAFGREDEAKLVQSLRKNPAFVPELSLVAWVEEEIVGHILFTSIQILDEENKIHQSLALAPMAVKPDFQKMGIGGELIRCGLEKAKELNYQSVIVLGHEAYYPKFGFQPAEKWKIRAPFEVPSSCFFAMELYEDALKDVKGIVNYPQEFEEV